jgi:AraC-like DNA-binding protein
VRYDRPGIAIVFDRAALAAPGNGLAPGFAELRRIVHRGNDQELIRALVDLVDLRLNDGVVAIDGAATRLGLRARTLQRHLQSQGLSYRQIVDTVRRARAENMLAGTATPIAEIATSLGYEEPAHFTRAFHRWNGCSPSKWRRVRSVAVKLSAAV